MGHDVRPAALLLTLVLTLLVIVVDAARTPPWTPLGVGDDNGASAMTPHARTRTRRIAVSDVVLDADKDDALLEALHRTAGSVQGVRPPMHKVTLTQVGYIQFLRYIVDVPEMRELSFCVWLRSKNLTHNHPVFSYSKDEKERIARAWVSPGQGARKPPRLHLAVMERLVFVEPLPEAAHRRWLHICSSWDGHSGQYRLYVDGRVRRAGVRQEVAGLELPAGGDIVVGQEYTDFDKGLDDGVEGDIFGFYLFRTATPRGPMHLSESGHDLDEDLQRQLLRAHRRADEDVLVRRRKVRSADAAADALPASSPAVSGPRPKRQHTRAGPGWPRYSLYSPPKDFMRPVPQRVQRLYALCTDHLTPEDRAEAVVSWPSTPVRVFGGAIISSVHKGCGNF